MATGPKDENARGKPWRARVVFVLTASIGATMLQIFPALAQGNGEWIVRIRTYATGSLPPGDTFAVAAQELDDVNTRLEPVIEQALMARGYQVSDQAGLQLWFDTELTDATVGDDSADANDTEVGDPAIEDEVLGRGTGAIGGEGRSTVEVVPEPTFSFSGNGPGQPGSRYSLTFVVGREGEPPIWQGGVTTRIAAAAAYGVAQAMVPLLADQIGKTVVAERSFPN